MNNKNNFHNIMFCPDFPRDKDYYLKKVLGKTGTATVVFSIENNLTVIHEILLTAALPLITINYGHENRSSISKVVSAIEDILNGTQSVRIGTQNFRLDKLPPFRRRVLIETLNIQYGETISYSQLAERAGNKMAIRAAGTAMATNPFPLIIPCHRVIKTDGTIGNYGGGIEMKRKLLKAEGVLLA
ncbi:MAG: MGMT family protein [Fibrobacteres bacterium]|nr:MGMT family protein [Fibrobacterota bacterium]